MADNHPFAAHRDHKVQKQRVPHIARGYASGGAVSSETGGAPTKRAVAHRDAVAVTGEPAKQRMDRPSRARGGRTKHKGTNVNILVGHPGTSSPAPGPAAGVGPVPALPPHPPGPPMLPPPGMAPPGAGAGPVPPMPMPGGAPGIRRHGGRNYAKGGAVFAEGKRLGTKVQHTNNKSDGANVGRGPVISKARGGAIEHPQTGGMAPKLPGGGRGGLARLAKAHAAAKHA